MRAREEVISELVQVWLDKAEVDFGGARVLLREDRYANLVGFLSQQAAEKLLKALLTHHQVEFPKTHELDDLLKLLEPAEPRLARSLAGIAELNKYGVEVRYPTQMPELTAETANAALRLAAQVREAVYAALGEAVPPVR